MAKCQVFKLDDEALMEVVPNGLYMKYYIGDNISVAVMKFVERKGANIPAKPHSHGEEVSLQVRGSCSVWEEDPVTGKGEEYPFETGQALIVPAGMIHTGTNNFDSEGLCLRLNVVTPPREEYSKEERKPFYPVKGQGGSVR